MAPRCTADVSIRRAHRRSISRSIFPPRYWRPIKASHTKSIHASCAPMKSIAMTLPICAMMPTGNCNALELQDMQCAWLAFAKAGKLPPSWQIATRLIANGFAGILVPSFAHQALPGAHNLVLWDWGPDLPTQAESCRAISSHGPDRAGVHGATQRAFLTAC